MNELMNEIKNHACSLVQGKRCVSNTGYYFPRASFFHNVTYKCATNLKC